MPSSSSTPTLEFRGERLSTRILAMPEENVTFISCDFGNRSFRFSVRGTELPFEVTFLHEFGEPDREPASWFVIAPEAATDPDVLQQYVYPQLVDIHRAELVHAMLPVP